MWTWSLSWGEITPRIVIGTCPTEPDDLGRIREGASVSAVFSLQHDECHAYWSIDYDEMCTVGDDLGLVMDRVPIRDFNNKNATLVFLYNIRDINHFRGTWIKDPIPHFRKPVFLVEMPESKVIDFLMQAFDLSKYSRV